MKKKLISRSCILIAVLLMSFSTQAQDSYSVVRIYLKETDSTIVDEPLKFDVDITNAGWIEFLTDFRAYFFSGQAQRLSRYQAQTVVNGVTMNTHLDVRFSDIAFIHINTTGYGLWPDCNNTLRDQYCSLIFKKSGHADSFFGSYSRGLSDLVLFFELRYLAGNVSGRNEYIIKSECVKNTNQLLLDWNFIRGIQLSHKEID